MKYPIRISCFLFLIATCSFSYGQMAEYNYKRELNEVSEQWSKIILPNEIFEKTSQDLSDLRIFGLTASNDTIEAPFLLREITEKISSKEVAFNTLNASHNEKGYYFTFEIPTIESINQIKLNFAQENFDWRIDLEGSQDQQEWFKLVENYRILSIKNDHTDFQFTKVTFPSSKYRFFRLLIHSKEKPELSAASIEQHEITDGKFRKYNIKKINTQENKQSKQTEVDIELQLPVRVSHINIGIADAYDYYRPVTIKCLTDSFRTEQGWKYNYSTLTSGILNSLEKNEFNFNSKTVQKLKIFIDNRDNQALTIDTIEVKGYIHELIARFTIPSTYFLTYGNKSASSPNYDIKRFTNNIPETLKTLELGEEMTIAKKEIPMAEPLFKNKIWLWVIMIVIITLLGWFSVNMIKKN